MALNAESGLSLEIAVTVVLLSRAIFFMSPHGDWRCLSQSYYILKIHEKNEMSISKHEKGLYAHYPETLAGGIYHDWYII
jgi:hypothetical protein